MHPRFLGDSFDIVKQSLLRWLAACAPWSAHPMFTEPVTTEDVRAYSRLVGAKVISQEVLADRTDRVAYFAPARRCTTHLFLDPDTGLRMRKTSGQAASSYLFGEELLQIAETRPQLLTLVFDQSIARGRERQQLESKLSALAAHALYGIAYVSHACFFLVGKKGALIKRAFETLKKESGLPESRFLKGEPDNNQMQRTRPPQATKPRR